MSTITLPDDDHEKRIAELKDQIADLEKRAEIARLRRRVADLENEIRSPGMWLKPGVIYGGSAPQFGDGLYNGNVFQPCSGGFTISGG